MKNDELSELASFPFSFYSVPVNPPSDSSADPSIPMYTANYASSISPLTSNMVVLHPSSCSLPSRFVHPPSAVYSCNCLNPKHPLVHLTDDCYCIYILSPLVSLPTWLGHSPIVLWLRMFAVDIEARPLHIRFRASRLPHLLSICHSPSPVQQDKVKISEWHVRSDFINFLPIEVYLCCFVVLNTR